LSSDCRIARIPGVANPFDFLDEVWAVNLERRVCFGSA
jgi:hypothetical protein